ncbi:MAG: GDP-mannose 4,6-dehydratase [Nanoarchaeota archaeon]
MKVLVTGGAGFIGSNLVEKLLNDKHKVVVIDDFSLGKKGNLDFAKGNKNLIIHQKSICDKDIKKYLKGIEVVFHVAALPRVQYSIKFPLETHKVNVNGTLNLLLASKKMNVKKFIFSSSSSIYGDQDKLPLAETMKPNPISPYALHKLIGEYYCKLFYDLYGLKTISLRYFNVFGPRQDPLGDYALLIPRFIDLINKNIRPTINGDGEQTRDFTYVQDVVEANISATSIKNKNVFGDTFNIGTGKNFSVNEVTSHIKNLLNKNVEPIYGPSVIEPKNTLADITKAKKLLGWQPKYKFEDGLKETIKYLTK